MDRPDQFSTRLDRNFGAQSETLILGSGATIRRHHTARRCANQNLERGRPSRHGSPDALVQKIRRMDDTSTERAAVGPVGEPEGLAQEAEEASLHALARTERALDRVDFVVRQPYRGRECGDG